MHRQPHSVGYGPPGHSVSGALRETQMSPRRGQLNSSGLQYSHPPPEMQCPHSVGQQFPSSHTTWSDRQTVLAMHMPDMHLPVGHGVPSGTAGSRQPPAPSHMLVVQGLLGMHVVAASGRQLPSGWHVLPWVQGSASVHGPVRTIDPSQPPPPMSHVTHGIPGQLEVRMPRHSPPMQLADPGTAHGLSSPQLVPSAKSTKTQAPATQDTLS